MPKPYTEAELAVIEQAAASDRQARAIAQELVARHFHDRSADALRIKIGVTVDNSPAMRKYVEFGKVLLLFTHGNEERHGDLPLIMAQERPDAWARTRYREAHLGHFHKKRVMSRVDIDEFAGVRVRILPSLCQSEAWHTSRGYVGNQRSAEAYAWCRATGLSSYLVWSVPEPVSAA